MLASSCPSSSSPSIQPSSRTNSSLSINWPAIVPGLPVMLTARPSATARSISCKTSTKSAAAAMEPPR